MPAAAMIITTNRGLACTGEELMFVCMSQGDSQWWKILNQDGSHAAEHTYSRRDSVGDQEQLTDRNQNRYTLVLISTAFENFRSTISVMATLSMHNVWLECHSHLPMVSVVIQIAGLSFKKIFSG